MKPPLRLSTSLSTGFSTKLTLVSTDRFLKWILGENHPVGVEEDGLRYNELFPVFLKNLNINVELEIGTGASKRFFFESFEKYLCNYI